MNLLYEARKTGTFVSCQLVRAFYFRSRLHFTVFFMKILSLIADAHLVVATSFMSHVRIYIISRSPLSIDWRHSSKCKIIKLKVECCVAGVTC